jgi:hypothetical protein
MSSIRVVVGIICVVLALVARGIWNETAVHALEAPITYDADTTAVSDPSDSAEIPWDGASETHRVDRYGNPIETAIGDYRVDRRGEVYERHSPDTAVPHLGVPST